MEEINIVAKNCYVGYHFAPRGEAFLTEGGHNQQDKTGQDSIPKKISMVANR